MQKPNILIVLSDQLTRRALSCYGDTNVQTSNIDALASEGTKFSKACSTYPICIPFRFSLMTGHYGHSRRVPGIDWRMSPAERTLADEFNDAGYHTAYIGKWHLWGGLGPGMMKRPIPREQRGRWEKWLGFEFRNSFFDNVYFEDDDPTPKKIEGYQTDGLFDIAIDHLTNRSDDKRPFCAIVSVEPPHPPYEAPPELTEKWLNKDIDLPDSFMVQPPGDAPGRGFDKSQYDQALQRRKIYYAMIENLDQNVGKLRKSLKESNLDKNTIVVFMADHGELGGCHCLHSKQQPYEESIGIPLIVWGPHQNIPSGRTIDDPVATEDLFPTICGLAGLPQRQDLYGANAAGLIYGKKEKLNRPGVMLEFVRELRPNMPFHGMPWRGFTSERYKYTVKFEENKGLIPWQFFDLQEDPYEMKNLLNEDGAFAQIISKHHGYLRQRMIETGDDEWLAGAFGYEPINEWALLEVHPKK